MPNFALLSEAVLVAAVAAGLTLWLVAWLGRPPRGWGPVAGWVLGLGVGIYAGCGVVGEWPRWPAPDDRDRFLVILLPLTLAIETAVAGAKSCALAWLARLCLAVAAAPILLYRSIYLADLSGPGSAEWSTAQAIAIFATLATLLLGVWGLLARLQSQSSNPIVAPAMVLTLLAAGVTVMLSGYYRGGLLGLPIAGAIAGATVAFYVAPRQPCSHSYVGIGIIGIFTVLLMGRFYGALPTSSALGLMLAPMLAAISEAPGVRRLGPRARAAARLVVVAVPLVWIVTCAQTRFNKASITTSKPR